MKRDLRYLAPLDALAVVESEGYALPLELAGLVVMGEEVGRARAQLAASLGHIDCTPAQAMAFGIELHELVDPFIEANSSPLTREVWRGYAGAMVPLLAQVLKREAAGEEC